MGARTIDAPAPLALWHLASLDAPTVAVVWALGFGWAAGVSLPAWVPVLLALAAWAAYIGDRVLDARAAFRLGAVEKLQQRHHFHHRHRQILIPLACVAAFGAACIVFSLMPSGARERNSVLAAAALVYFTRVHSPRGAYAGPETLLGPLLQKELGVGLIFSAACALPAISRAVTEAGVRIWPLAVAAVYFALLAWLNCYLIEQWETGAEEQRQRAFSLAALLALMGLALAGLLFEGYPRAAALLAAGAVSALLLAVLDRWRGRMTPLALRAAADLVLLTPAWLLLR